MTSTALAGKTAFVTGGHQGIGRAIVETLAAAGANVAAVDANPAVADSAAEIGKHAGTEVIGIRADVTSGDDVAAAVAEVAERLGPVYVLVNNAGIVGKRAFARDGEPDTWLKTLNVNLIGTYRVTRAVVPQLVQARAGRVINISSMSGKQGSLGNSAYSASKHGALGLTRTLAQEFGALGLGDLTANAVCPGVADTPLVHDEGGLIDGIAELTGAPREAVMGKYLLTQNLQHRLMDAQEIADMVAYLASDRARGITGQAINVCGGSVFY